MWYMYVIEISFKQMDKLVNIKEEVERDLYSKVRIKWASACTLYMYVYPDLSLS